MIMNRYWKEQPAITKPTITRLGYAFRQLSIWQYLFSVAKATSTSVLLVALVGLSTVSVAQSGSQQSETIAGGGPSSAGDIGATSETANPSTAKAAVDGKASEEAASGDAAAKEAAQNPLANTISVPFQNDTYFNTGPYKRALNALIIEPVIPIKLTENWNLITRTITPLIYEPRVSPTQGSVFGLGNMQPQFYFSPAHPGKLIWGLGPQLWLPTATDDTLGVNKFGGGPAGVVVTSFGHWMVGSIVNNVWTGQNKHHQEVNQLTLNPFAFYNLPKGWYVMTSPIMTADWTAKPGQKWTIPVGGGVGRVFKIGFQPLNTRVQFFKDVKQPTFGPSWTMQAQVQFLFVRK